MTRVILRKIGRATKPRETDSQQLVDFGHPVPGQGPGMFDEMIEGVIRAVDRRQIPSGQYRAILIDEGHDFTPQWLRLVTQMVHPETSSLLLLCDDAQSIYERQRSRQFSFKSVGIQAQGLTTILKIKDRNTRPHPCNRCASEPR